MAERKMENENRGATGANGGAINALLTELKALTKAVIKQFPFV